MRFVQRIVDIPAVVVRFEALDFHQQVVPHQAGVLESSHDVADTRADRETEDGSVEHKVGFYPSVDDHRCEVVEVEFCSANIDVVNMGQLNG
jgi:hypothetical protein